ncbi:AraC family transcriptional regulator [Pigmentiphaga soli]|uniref:AraC family transcriptional regulator n=2 Tax=Pigmentiphaga soli TaxID=1007095 RepID=A0ABP8HJ92_9BURK
MAQLCDYVDFDIRRQGPRRSAARLHRHDYFQMHVHLEGSAQMHMAMVTRQLAPGAVTFILPDKVHFHSHPPGCRYYVLSFGLRFLRGDLDVGPLELEDVPLARAPELAPFLFQETLDYDLDAGELAEAARHCEAMLAENAVRGFYALEMIRSHLLALIGQVCRRYAASFELLSADQHGRASRRAAIKRVVKFMRENYMRRIMLEDVANAVCLSPNYLSHLIKRELGKSFVDLLTGLRMEAAKPLLLDTRLRVSDIAEQIGFDDEAYFSRRFRQIEGRTPSAYRGTARRG